MKKDIWHILLVASLTFSCDMDKEIDLNLPEYNSKMVIECYLEPGKPYRLTITESVSYFESPILPTVDSALVVITHNNIVDTLNFNPYLDVISGKYYNYRSAKIVPNDYSSEFSLFVKDKKGRTATSKTSILQVVPIDTVELSFNQNKFAQAFTKFKDNTATKNYYQCIVSKEGISSYRMLSNNILDDAIYSSSEIVIGSKYELITNDSVTVALFHIKDDYYNFLESINLAQDANGNPFGQPAKIKSNIQGAIGIFTGLSSDKKSFKVP